MDRKDQNISFTRGDTEQFFISATYDGTGTIYTFSSSDQVTMTCRKTWNDTTVQFQKSGTIDTDNNRAVIRIEHSDTSEMEFGKYVYDIQITFADGEVKTLCKGILMLGEEATW